MNMDTIRNFFSENDQLARYLGAELLEVTEGCAKARLTVRKEHLNGVGTTHGGTIFSLADYAFAAACNSHGTIAVALNMSVAYVKATTTGAVLTADCRQLSINPKIANYDIRVTDETGDIVATLQAMAYRKKNLLPIE